MAKALNSATDVPRYVFLMRFDKNDLRPGTTGNSMSAYNTASNGNTNKCIALRNRKQHAKLNDKIAGVAAWRFGT